MKAAHLVYQEVTGTFYFLQKLIYLAENSSLKFFFFWSAGAGGLKR
jgi:hypothetical protein